MATPKKKKKRKLGRPKKAAAKKKKRKPKVGPKPGRTYQEKLVLQDPKTGHFLPGNHANPYGRPPATLSIKDAYARALKRAHKKGGRNGDKSVLDEIMDRMVHEALGAALKDKLAVLKEAADRLEGKPAQTVHMPGKGVNSDLTEAELDAILACKVVDDEGEDA